MSYFSIKCSPSKTENIKCTDGMKIHLKNFKEMFRRAAFKLSTDGRSMWFRLTVINMLLRIYNHLPLNSVSMQKCVQFPFCVCEKLKRVFIAYTSLHKFIKIEVALPSGARLEAPELRSHCDQRCRQEKSLFFQAV